jgi:hypothetical protein
LAAHKYAVIEALPEHVAPMLPIIRPEDVEELWAANRVSPEYALRHGIACSTASWTGTVDGRPVCMFGVAPASMLGSVGVPWMIGTVEIDQHAKAFLRRNKAYVDRMATLYNYLVNYVDSRNTRAIVWLKWLGFTIHDAQAHGPDGVPFHRFDMRANHV